MEVKKIEDFDFTDNNLSEIKSCMQAGVYFCKPPQNFGEIKYKCTGLDCSILDLPTKQEYNKSKSIIFSIATIISALFVWKMLPGINGVMHIFAIAFGLAIIFGIAFAFRNNLSVHCFYISEKGIFYGTQEKYQGADIETKTVYFKNATLDITETEEKIGGQTRSLTRHFLFKDTHGNSITLVIDRDRFASGENRCQYLLCKEAVRYYKLCNS